MGSRLAATLLVLLTGCSTAPIGDYRADPADVGGEPPRTTDDGDGSTSTPSDGGGGGGGGQSFTLTVNVTGAGSGSVVSTPSGLSCQDKTCTGTFPAGSAVGLVAAPDAGSAFAGWSGACSGTGSCTATMNANVTVTAAIETFAGTYTGSYTHSVTIPGCTFNNSGTLSIAVAADGTAFGNTASITGVELKNTSKNPCTFVKTSTGTSSKEAITLAGTTATGTWTFVVQDAAGQFVLPYTATWSGKTLTGSWTCTGCTGSFTLNKP